MWSGALLSWGSREWLHHRPTMSCSKVIAADFFFFLLLKGFIRQIVRSAFKRIGHKSTYTLLQQLQRLLSVILNFSMRAVTSRQQVSATKLKAYKHDRAKETLEKNRIRLLACEINLMELGIYPHSGFTPNCFTEWDCEWPFGCVEEHRTLVNIRSWPILPVWADLDNKWSQASVPPA